MCGFAFRPMLGHEDRASDAPRESNYAFFAAVIFLMLFVLAIVVQRSLDMECKEMVDMQAENDGGRGQQQMYGQQGGQEMYNVGPGYGDPGYQPYGGGGGGKNSKGKGKQQQHVNVSLGRY